MGQEEDLGGRLQETEAEIYKRPFSEDIFPDSYFLTPNACIMILLKSSTGVKMIAFGEAISYLARKFERNTSNFGCE